MMWVYYIVLALIIVFHVVLNSRTITFIFTPGLIRSKTLCGCSAYYSGECSKCFFCIVIFPTNLISTISINVRQCALIPDTVSHFTVFSDIHCTIAEMICFITKIYRHFPDDQVLSKNQDDYTDSIIVLVEYTVNRKLQFDIPR